MKITDEGSKLVQSLEFAEELRTFLVDLHEKGVPEERGTAYATALIAWAATGHKDMKRKPTGHELIDLENFVLSNVSAIDALAAKCLGNLVKADTGAVVH
jgi:hypothetical protein